MSGLRVCPAVGDTSLNYEHVRSQRVERGLVCLPPSPDGDVESGTLSKRREQLDPYELAQPAFESVAIDRRVLVEGNHDPNARNAERGSEDSHIEVHGPDSLPLSNDGL